MLPDDYFRKKGFRGGTAFLELGNFPCHYIVGSVKPVSFHRRGLSTMREVYSWVAAARFYDRWFGLELWDQPRTRRGHCKRDSISPR